MVRRRLQRIVVENILREACRQKPGHVVAIMWVRARFAAVGRNSALGIRSGHVRGKIQVQELISYRAAIGSLVARTDCKDFKRTSPIQGRFLFENLGVSICAGLGSQFGTLADGSLRVVHPCMPKASESFEFRLSIRETVSACCSRTGS